MSTTNSIWLCCINQGTMRPRLGQLSTLHWLSKSETKYQHLPHERNDINRQNAKKNEIEIHGDVYTFTRAIEILLNPKKY